MLQMFLGPIPSGSIMKAPLEMNEQCSCNYLGRLLHISALNSCQTSMQNAPWVPRENSFKFHYWIPIEIYGKCSWSFWCQFLHISFEKPYWNKWEMLWRLLEFLGSSPVHPYLIKSQWKMFLQLPGPIPQHFLLKSSFRFMGHAPNASWAHSCNMHH